MFVVTTEVAPHVRVSKAFDRASLWGPEIRAHRTIRRQLNAHAAAGRAAFNPRPRLVKPAAPQVISLADFKASRASQPEVEAVVLLPQTVATFDQREQVAQRAGL
jgi:hypothetical protein